MIPQGTSLSEAELRERTETSRTYKLDSVGNRVIGLTDGLDAVRQSAFKILQTERYRFFCYSADYGVELEGLVGADPAFVRSELKRRVSEALLQDDRISEVNDFVIEIDGDGALAAFTVVSDFGSFREEVRQNV
ncbi:DUF2634 domain-containing protein [Paenibacillus harenae]|uniref:DUF2634 domain-containing protein n=1 Tax=Paenibacillus harenae TaxID=306543 RepID=UPI00278EC8D6|nr:DUF2634 domain-containing protein [Paenibacillus harenae]MDQ0063562.1 hypothetical protein [Paenibacillus harenae]